MPHVLTVLSQLWLKVLATSSQEHRNHIHNNNSSRVEVVLILQIGRTIIIIMISIALRVKMLRNVDMHAQQRQALFLWPRFLALRPGYSDEVQAGSTERL